jgi:GH15 family glucan-1,4-alpha-glucosidase
VGNDASPRPRRGQLGRARGSRDDGDRRPSRSVPPLNAQPERIDGYAPIRDYAAIGDGRTLALVARDGSIDWLCLPNLDSASVFAGLLDAGRGGRFLLEPAVPYETKRHYLPTTNVLETTFETAEGSVRLTDAMTLPTVGLAPDRELVRRVEALSGRVPMRWLVEPRFHYAEGSTRLSLRAGVPVATAGREAVAFRTWDAGEARAGDSAFRGSFDAAPGRPALIVLSAAHQEPLVLPTRDEVERRLEETTRWWRWWTGTLRYDGPWRDQVLRSALVLKLLVFAPSGAIAAAPTTSLPEVIGGERNWDYRFTWPRDASFTLEALLELGYDAEARAFFSWLMHATQLTHPRFQVLYRLDGRTNTDEHELTLEGYRRSRPVRRGNAAARQNQLDVYGELLQAAASFAAFEGGLDRDEGKRLGEVADLVCETWKEPDAGIWESRSEPKHFTHSKMMCAVALRIACELAEQGRLPDGHDERWQREHARVRDFVETQCYSESKRSYVRSAGSDDLDASLLLAVLAGYDDARSPRLLATVDAVRRELGRGPLIVRHLADDGLPGEDGAFLSCSFWLAEAYARQERSEDAVALMEELVGQANDVGLFSEEMDPATGAFLGNHPQGLTHLALISAAVALAAAKEPAQ